MNKVALTSIAEDYAELDGSEGTIGTFPPDLIGVVSPKNKFPHLFKMGILGTTEADSETTFEVTEEPSTIVEIVEEARTTQEVTHEQTTTFPVVTETVLDAEMKNPELETPAAG